MDNLNYQGSNITGYGKVKNEVTVRLGKAARAFSCLHMLCSRTQSLEHFGMTDNMVGILGKHCIR